MMFVFCSTAPRRHPALDAVRGVLANASPACGVPAPEKVYVSQRQEHMPIDVWALSQLCTVLKDMQLTVLCRPALTWS